MTYIVYAWPVIAVRAPPTKRRIKLRKRGGKCAVSDATVLAIRTRWHAGGHSMREIAAEFGITYSLARQIILYVTHSKVEIVGVR